MKQLLVALALAGGVLNTEQACPGSVWCDYHSMYATYSGDEYPNGVHYMVFSHSTAGGTHKIRQKCK